MNTLKLHTTANLVAVWVAPYLMISALPEMPLPFFTVLSIMNTFFTVLFMLALIKKNEPKEVVFKASVLGGCIILANFAVITFFKFYVS